MASHPRPLSLSLPHSAVLPRRVEDEDINLPKLIRVGKPQFSVAPTSAGTKLSPFFLPLYLSPRLSSYSLSLPISLSATHSWHRETALRESSLTYSAA